MSITTSNLGKVTITPKGEWVTGTYARLDLVTLGGASYLSKEDNNTQIPSTLATKWQVIAQNGQDSWFNVTARIPLSAGSYYTLATALAQVPSGAKTKGFYLLFESSANVWKMYQFLGVVATEWATEAKWRDVTPYDVMSTINDYSNLWYGVSWNNTVFTIPSSKTRIGSSDLHRSLPVHSKMKGCLMADDGTIIKYLPKDTWVGETLDGTSGQVMVELPEYYFKVDDTDQTNVQLKISTLPLPNFEYSPKMYIGAYKGVIDRTIPATLKLASVVNSAVEFRGGNNSATNDSNENSLLGKASSAITGTNYRTYARNRNAGDTRWNRYTYEAWRKLVFLYLIEYANTNSQATYNAALDVNGFKQGGLGMGVTQINSTKWGTFNGYYPFVPIGYSNSIGNGTGEIAYTMPYLYDGGAAYKGDYSTDATYVAGDYIAAKSINKLYTCIADAPAGTLLSDTNYFTEVTRTTTLVNRYRGVELPFGEVFENLDGTLINADADNQNVKLYLCNNPKDYGNILTDKYIYRAELPTSSDYIKKIMLGKSGDILPLKDGLGASTSNGWGDYHYASIASSGLRALFVGGSADVGAAAGLVCSGAVGALSYATARIGSRLCFIP